MEASVVSMCKVRFFLLVSPCRVLCDSNFVLRAPPSQLDPKQKSRKQAGNAGPSKSGGGKKKRKHPGGSVAAEPLMAGELPPAAPAAVPAVVGTASAGGGRWVHAPT